VGVPIDDACCRFLTALLVGSWSGTDPIAAAVLHLRPPARRMPTRHSQEQSGDSDSKGPFPNRFCRSGAAVLAMARWACTFERTRMAHYAGAASANLGPSARSRGV
jgi:hypothetical protein